VNYKPTVAKFMPIVLLIGMIACDKSDPILEINCITGHYFFLCNNYTVCADFSSSAYIRTSVRTEGTEVLISFIREQRPYQNQLTHLEDGIVITIPFRVGVHDLVEPEFEGASKHSTRGWYGHGAEEDSGGHIYLIDQTKTSTLMVTSIDTLARKVGGSFEAHFLLHEKSTHDYDFAERVHFAEGEFCLTYEDFR